MTTIPVEPISSPDDWYASDDDVRHLLGTLRTRLPDWVVISEYLEVAHGLAVGVLAKVYPGGVPDFTGDAATVVRWAEAKIAAGEILSAIRVNLDPEAREVPDQMRAEAYETLGGPIVGFPVGGEEVDDDGDPDTPGIIVNPSPRVSSFTPMSAFPDPYDAARVAYGSERSF